MTKDSLFLALALALSSQVSAQDAAPQAPISLLPDTSLADHMRTLAHNPHDLNALIGAGQSALSVGDATAAMGFFGRANNEAPNDGRVKAGLGSTLLLLERPEDALRLFGEAVALGIPEQTIAIDRGLAYDLRGDQANAQRDYRLALRNGQSDELLRRYALSLGISGDSDTAMHQLDPLLRKRDEAAWRDRTFILAMNGDLHTANAITHEMMPQSADALSPFLKRLENMTPAQRALAVTYGSMPEDARPATPVPANVIAPLPALVSRPVAVQIAVAKPPARPPVLSPAPKPAPPKPVYAALALALAPAPAPAPAPISIAAAKPVPVPPPPSVPTVIKPAPAPVAFVAAKPKFNLASLLDDVKPDAQSPSAALPSDKELRVARRLAREKTAEKTKADAEAKAKHDLEAANPAREWVQVAGGNNRRGFAHTWKALKADHPDLFRHQSAYTTPLNHTYRILVGPFDGPREARAFVNKLSAAGLTGFTFSSDAGQEVTSIGAKSAAENADAGDQKRQDIGTHHRHKHRRK